MSPSTGGGSSGWRRPRGRSAPRDGASSVLIGPLRTLLGNRPLTRMVVAFAGVTIAEWAYVTALAVDAFRRDGSIAVGLVGLRLFFAAASSFLGVGWVHRRPAGRLLTYVAGVRAVGLAASAVLAASGAPFGLLFLPLALDAVVSAQYRPAQSALMPTLARTPTELAAATTGLSSVKTLSQAVGAALGGVLLSVTTPDVVFIGAGVLFALIAAITSRWTVGMVTPEAGATGATTGNRPSVGVLKLARDTVAVMRYPGISGILLVSGLRTFVRGMWIATAVIASLKLLHAGSTGVGLLMLAAGLGALVAAPLSSMLVTRSRVGMPAAVALISGGIPLAIIAGAPVFDLALGLIVAWGVGMAVSDVATSLLLQRAVEAPMVPRVVGAIESAKLALEGLGGFIAPVAISTIGVRSALVIAAVPLPIGVFIVWTSLHRVDASADQRTGLLHLLHQQPCLQPLDMASLDLLVSRLTTRLVTEVGIDVVRQHDEGHEFFVIETGTAEVIVDTYMVAILGAGQSFGERALLRGVPRSATVRSLSPMTLLVLSREDFLTALTGEPTVEPHAPVTAAAVSTEGWTRRDRARVLSRLQLALPSRPPPVSISAWPPTLTKTRSPPTRSHLGRAALVNLIPSPPVSMLAVPAWPT